MKLRARTDGNQTKIVEGLRNLGHSVALTHQLGKGFPDMVVGADGYNFLFEIKDPEQPPSKRKLTEDEIKFNDDWDGQIDVIETVEEALNIIDIYIPIAGV